MSQALAALLAILDLEQTGQNSFRGHSPQPLRKRVFGGQLIAQALVAAARTVEGRAPHSLHAYFLLPGDASTPISYDVERLRDGGSFATRRCEATQHGRTIFTLTASFQTEEEGLDHCLPMPEAPDPETLMTRAEMGQAFAHMMPAAMQRYFTQAQPIDVRPVDLARYYAKADRTPLPAQQNVWMRANGALPDDPAVHRAVLAYFSDMTLLDTALVKHQRSVFDEDIQGASLDHALWFHRPFRADEWLLYAQQSPNANGARGLARGSLFSRDGRLVASVMQEGLLRLRTDKPMR
jgi:acyl-CoA thioesterase-2